MDAFYNDKYSAFHTQGTKKYAKNCQKGICNASKKEKAQQPPSTI